MRDFVKGFGEIKKDGIDLSLFAVSMVVMVEL